MIFVFAGSSNGRTAPFGGVSGGSNPPPAARLNITNIDDVIDKTEEQSGKNQSR